MHLQSSFLKIGKNTFQYLRTREKQNVSVYCSNHTYLRIGPVSIVQAEMGSHNSLLYHEFPVPKIQKSGWINNRAYYIETSLGKKQFSKLFSDDYFWYGAISPTHFKSFMKLVKQYARAQLGSRGQAASWPHFLSLIYVPILKKEMPHLAVPLARIFSHIKKRLASFPFVLSHGDFNPHNIFPQGVIDMERVAYMPAGYDLITAIAHIDMFPWNKTYEFHRTYQLSAEQKNQYFATIDALYQSAGLPAPSNYIKEFSFCRAVWSAARMQKYPRLQTWRFDVLKQLAQEFL